MENKNIIIILLIVIVILAAAIGVMFLSPFDVKTDTKLTITSNETLYEGDNLTVKLTDINGTGISDETVNVTITDKNGGSYRASVITNSSGIGVLELDKKAGNFTVNCTYGGNENYTGNSTQQKLEIREVVEEPVVQQSSSSYTSSSSSSKSSQSDYRPAVDSGGVTREEADYWGWQYTPEHGGHYHGSRDAWDEEAGVYHD